MSRRLASGIALLAVGVAMILLALWLRNPVLPYDGDASAASGHYDATVRAQAMADLRSSLQTERARLTRDALHALGAPPTIDKAFDHLASIKPAPEEGIVLFDGSTPVAWSGQVTVDPSLNSAPFSVSITPFYTVISAVAQKGNRKAIATAVVNAEPPGNRLSKSLDARIPNRERLQRYVFGLGADTTAGESVLAVQGNPVLRAEAVPLPRAIARFARAAKVRAFGTILLCAALLVLLGFAWRDRKLLLERLVSVGVCLAAISFVPWSSFSNTVRAFDPTYFYSGVIKPFTANAGVFAISASFMLMAVFALVRARSIRVSRWVALPLAVVIAAEAVVLAMRIARGIAFPTYGTTASLWLFWEIPLFVFIFAGWLAATWILRFALRRRGVIHLRSAAIVAVAAGIAASTIVWRQTIAKRIALASEDVSRLQRPDRDASDLLRRFGAQLVSYESAGDRADLLKRYAVSDLAAADLPLSLATWDGPGERTAVLSLAPIAYDSGFVARLASAARDSADPIIVETVGATGRQVVMAARHNGSGVTTVVAAPRTQLVRPDPFVSLLGISSPGRGEPPYSLTISDITARTDAGRDSMVWRRNGDELHGDRLIQTSRGLARAHAEVDLRTIPARIERLVLIVILNVAIAGFLWALCAIPEGGFTRWVRARAGKWIRSYRGRLTFALSAFFAIPALAFALWSYQRLRSDDRDVRELLVRETLDAVVREGDSSSAVGVRRPYNTPLFLYSSGLLSAASDSLLDALSSPGRALPVPVQLTLVGRGELDASWQHVVGGSSVLFGYRTAAGPLQERYVVAAPARSDELALDRRRYDLTILVLFATVMGALAAFWLSGVAARVLARDLELSRIEVGRAERILAWGEMARQVAHEIKNPLTPIRLGVQHLRRARSDPRLDFDKVLEENVTRILAEIDRLDEIARSFSRYGSAPSELSPAEDIDVAAILRNVVALERMGVGDVTWNLVGAERPITAKARADELRDVLLNVFENARLARARNVDVVATERPRDVTIEIQDNGTGIDRSALPRVFEPQFSTRTTGSGLGLAISRRLLESWGGTIEIASEEGHGTRVVLTLQRTL
ncbi:MAG TPA: ATP-binding protein [Gemmatimonadaceae bacterium]|nr:ATP-binding protein [Gemmatimonadaceae bacterium]